jgi:hypothetical protein
MHFEWMPERSKRTHKQLRLQLGNTRKSRRGRRMKSLFRVLATSTILTLMFAVPLVKTVNAQSSDIIPLPLPSIGKVPDASSSEQETHDKATIEQLMFLVELSRQIGGGITKLFETLDTLQETAKDQLDAVTGTKTVPMANGPAEIAARKGGTSIREMATEGLGGTIAEPTDIADAFQQFRTTYDLDKAFDYQKEDTLAQVTVAHMASYGAVGAASAERIYKRANESMDRIDDYITTLGASNDLKTSIDLNTRVNIEIAQQLNEMLRGQATLTSMVSMYYVVSSSVRADMEDNFDLKRLLGQP